jgi:hypothetical protein
VPPWNVPAGNLHHPDIFVHPTSATLTDDTRGVKATHGRQGASDDHARLPAHDRSGSRLASMSAVAIAAPAVNRLIQVAKPVAIRVV